MVCVRFQLRKIRSSQQPEIVFPAKLAYECLTSVPFNRTVATQFLQYYKDTLQFQSTLAYLKNPPSSYQQPAVDLLAGIDLIQRQIDTGVFHNEYAFEAAVQNLVYQTHDGHIELFAGALNVFTFGSALPIVSLSADGFALPKVYISCELRFLILLWCLTNSLQLTCILLRTLLPKESISTGNLLLSARSTARKLPRCMT